MARFTTFAVMVLCSGLAAHATRSKTNLPESITHDMDQKTNKDQETNEDQNHESLSRSISLLSLGEKHENINEDQKTNEETEDGNARKEGRKEGEEQEEERMRTELGEVLAAYAPDINDMKGKTPDEVVNYLLSTYPGLTMDDTYATSCKPALQTFTKSLDAIAASPTEERWVMWEGFLNKFENHVESCGSLLDKHMNYPNSPPKKPVCKWLQDSPVQYEMAGIKGIFAAYASIARQGSPCIQEFCEVRKEKEEALRKLQEAGKDIKERLMTSFALKFISASKAFGVKTELDPCKSKGWFTSPKNHKESQVANMALTPVWAGQVKFNQQIENTVGDLFYKGPKRIEGVNDLAELQKKVPSWKTKIHTHQYFGPKHCSYAQICCEAEFWKDLGEQDCSGLK